MFREMRRKDKQLPIDESIEILKKAEYINKAKGSIKVMKIDIEHMTGKAQK